MKKLSLFLFIVSMVFVSCGKDDEMDQSIHLTNVTISLNFGETYQIEATSISTLTYVSSSEYHATVSSTGLVSAMFVGETTLTLTNEYESKTIEVTILPTVDLYPEPEVSFGQSKSSVVAQFGTPDVEDESTIFYTSYSADVPYLLFMFDDNDMLEGYSLLVPTSYSSALGSFISQRYFLFDSDNLIFINGLSFESANMAVVTQLYNVSYWMVAYLPIDQTLKSSAHRVNITPVVKRFNNLLFL